ncbi:MAG: LarC family nickel insertion protein, partial [Coriobacteriia bacterium]|nr:LarC family nickel insertion protein [Coriobacteriia bacterium]
MILHFDLSTGASGDKVLGALLELCEAQRLTNFAVLEQKAVQLLPGVSLHRNKVKRAGIAATHITVNPPPIHQRQHRHWKEIRELIAAAVVDGIIDQGTAELATRVFARVAVAEAKVHGTTAEQVHFHEVGADDSIIDILFSSYLLKLLKPTAVYATPMALGSGTLVCAHGELPVPAPATVEILLETGDSAGDREGDKGTAGDR